MKVFQNIVMVFLMLSTVVLLSCLVFIPPIIIIPKVVEGEALRLLGFVLWVIVSTSIIYGVALSRNK